MNLFPSEFKHDFVKKRKTNGMYRTTNKLFQSNFVSRKKAMSCTYNTNTYKYQYSESTSQIMMCIIHPDAFGFLNFFVNILIQIYLQCRLCDVVIICTQPHRYIKPMHQLLEKSLSLICECISDALSFLASHIVLCHRQCNEIFQLSMIFWPRKKNFVPTCTN